MIVVGGGDRLYAPESRLCVGSESVKIHFFASTLVPGTNINAAKKSTFHACATTPPPVTPAQGNGKRRRARRAKHDEAKNNGNSGDAWTLGSLLENGCPSPAPLEAAMDVSRYASRCGDAHSLPRGERATAHPALQLAVRRSRLGRQGSRAVARFCRPCERGPPTQESSTMESRHVSEGPFSLSFACSVFLRAGGRVVSGAILVAVAVGRFANNRSPPISPSPQSVLGQCGSHFA